MVQCEKVTRPTTTKKNVHEKIFDFFSLSENINTHDKQTNKQNKGRYYYYY